jgi:DNA polymerase-3 subunit delta
MFADFKLVIVRDFNQMQINDVESFKKYLDHPQKSCCLVLSATEQIKRELDTALMKTATVVDCPIVRSWNLPKWIKNYCREHGYTIDDYCAGFIAEQTGESLLALEKEMQKIFSYKGDDKVIKAEDLEQTTGLTNDFNIFALQDAILEKNYQRCLKISRRLLDSGLYIHPIVASLFTFFRKYLMVRTFENRKADQEILKAAQIRDFQLKKYKAHFSNYSSSQIRRAIILLQKFDVELKSTNIDDFSGLQMLFYKICS